MAGQGGGSAERDQRVPLVALETRCGLLRNPVTLQGYLAHKKQPPFQDCRRTMGIVLL